VTPPIRFEETAPLALRRPDSLAAFAGALRARPGEWALLGRYSTGGAAGRAAYLIRHGINRAFADGGFEAQAATLFGEHRVYVRWTGGAQ
jgi:hypothetical protein